MLVDGKWSANWQPVQKSDEKGGFVRQTSSFRHAVTPDGAPAQGGFKAEKGRYRLIAAFICPWASRILAARKLKKLEKTVDVTIVEPELTDQGWRFSCDGDAETGARYLHELYSRADAKFTGRATVPILWDRRRETIVNNESADLLRMFNSGFGALADDAIDLYPADLRENIDALNDEIYPNLNNGVYRAGFATTQIAYNEAFAQVFQTLDALEQRLGAAGPFLFGPKLTETDIRLFVTLIRFDAAYHGLFKCNLRKISDYPALTTFLKTMLAVEGLKDTVNIDHIKRGYYSIKSLNPNGIVPQGPDLSALGL